MMYVSVNMFVTRVQLVSAACGMSCCAVKHYTQQPTTNVALSQQYLVTPASFSDITFAYSETVNLALSWRSLLPLRSTGLCIPIVL